MSVCRLVGEQSLLRELLKSSRCVLLLLKASSRGRFGKPGERELRPLEADTKQRLVFSFLFHCRCLVTSLHVTTFLLRLPYFYA
jgi:hypothetical protein